MQGGRGAQSRRQHSGSVRQIDGAAIAVDGLRRIVRMAGLEQGALDAPQRAFRHALLVGVHGRKGAVEGGLRLVEPSRRQLDFGQQTIEVRQADARAGRGVARDAGLHLRNALVDLAGVGHAPAAHDDAGRQPVLLLLLQAERDQILGRRKRLLGLIAIGVQ